MIGSVKTVLAALLIPALWAAVAAGDDPWMGRKVFWKPGTVAKIGETPVRADLIPFGATVGAVEGDWLWLHRAWIRKSDVHTTEQALEFHSGEIERDPTDATAYCRRGTVWKHKREFAKAVQDFSRAIQLEPGNALAYACRGSARDSLGHTDLAIADCGRAILLDPNCAIAYLNRGVAEGNRGELDEAIEDFTSAIRLDPTEAVAYRNRGLVWSRLGQYDHALGDCTAALKLDRTCIDAYNDSAWLRATCPDARYRNGRKALANAELACELSEWKNWRCIGTLAAAHAELGDYDKAIEWQKRAIALTDNESDRREERKHLERFQTRWPLREEVVLRRPAFRSATQR